MRSGSASVRCRSISTVTGPSGVCTTRCGTTWPSKTQRAANVTSPMPGRSRVPSGSRTSASAAGASGAVAFDRARLVRDVADHLARDRGARGADEQHDADGGARDEARRDREQPAARGARRRRDRGSAARGGGSTASARRMTPSIARRSSWCRAQAAHSRRCASTSGSAAKGSAPTRRRNSRQVIMAPPRAAGRAAGAAARARGTAASAPRPAACP